MTAGRKQEVVLAHDVFISHSSRDKTIADAVCATLEARGIRCWIAPRDIRPGESWSEAIIRGLKGCRAVVLVFSSHANDSPQVEREVQYAFEHGATVIPFRVEEVKPAESLEFYITGIHWLDALTRPLENHLAHLADSVQHILSDAPGRPPSSAIGAEKAAPRPPKTAPVPSGRRFPYSVPLLAAAGACGLVLLTVIVTQALTRGKSPNSTDAVRGARQAANSPTSSQELPAREETRIGDLFPDGSNTPDAPTGTEITQQSDEGGKEEPLGPQTPAEVRAAIEASYEKLRSALTRKDADAYQALLAPDYVSVKSDGGIADRAASMEAIRVAFGISTSIEATYEIQKLTMSGQDVVATVKSKTVINSILPTTLEGVDRDTWTRIGSGWLMKKSQTLSLENH